jgi:tagatose 6-phosphate kinase
MILVAGLTPAWQQVLILDAFRPGEVNRARQVCWCASGKVLNAARAVHHLGGAVRAVTVVGGTPGEEIRRDFRQLGVAARWLESATPTRVCTTVLNTADQTVTELVPEAGGLSTDERDAFRAAYEQEVSVANVVILIGSLPAGTPTSFYRELLTRASGKTIVDARGEELLDALVARPFLVKPNRQELARTLGRELRRDEELFEAMRELNRRGAEWVLVTDGPNPAYASCANELYRLQPVPALTLNPIGCGDCMAGAVAWAVGSGQPPLDALRYGLAAAADKLSRPLPGSVERAAVERLAQSVEITRLSAASGR